MKKDVRLKGRLQRLLCWPLYLSIIVVAMTVTAYFFNIFAGIICSALAAAYLIIALWLFFGKRPMIMRDVTLFAVEQAQIQRQLISDLDVPYALLDEQGRVIWINTAFGKVIKKEKCMRKKITDLFTVSEGEPFDGGMVYDIAYNDRYYRLHIKNIYISDDEGNGETDSYEAGLMAAYLFDETETVLCRQEIEDQKLVVGLIYLDNYEEALMSTDEVRRSLFLALIDRKIDKYINNINGIVRKLEKDKYFIVIQNKYLGQLRSERFSLLEDIKTVKLGNDMFITLSIGLGVGGENYMKNYEYARAAVDMALGRGGDQAVLKNGEKIHYYGGKSQSQEKNTRVKARMKANALRELIETRGQIFVMGHKLGDVDSLGAGIGIYRVCAELGKKAHIILDDVTASVRPMADRFIGNPDYPEDLFIHGDKAAEMAGPDALLVVVDVNRPNYTEYPKLCDVISTTAVLDHHRQSRDSFENAVLSYVEPYASSTCEMVAEVLQYIVDDVHIRQAEADAMYGGIVIDTNNFMNKTGVRTFEAAAFLRRHGADVVRVRKMFRDNMSDYKARAEAVRNVEVFEDSFAICVCPAEGVESPTVVAAQAANELLNIIGIRASFVLTAFQGQVYISARSIDEVNVQIIMEKLGGGGHMSVAGAQLAGVTVEQAKEQLKATVKSMLDKGAI